MHVVGDVIKGYRIVGTLGRGGLGTTYEAEREGLGGRVALKRLAVAQATEWKQIELFERESRVLADLQHPAIPRYLDHFAVDGPQGPTLYIAQELVVGVSLADVVRSSGPVGEPEARRLAEEVLRVLDYLGRRVPPVIHRDIKPENLLRRTDGTVAVVDFGAARAELTGPAGGSTTVGTYGYMAPEQLHGVASPATDVYGLGCTLLFLLTGRAPTELPRKKLHIDVAAATRGVVTPPFARWLARALEPAAEDRFPSAASALAGLRGLPGGGGPPVDLRAPRTRSLTGFLMAAFAVVASAAALAFALLAPTERTTTSGARSSIAAAPGDPGDLPARWAVKQRRPPMTWLRWWGAHVNPTQSVAVSPSGERVASGGFDGAVKVWDLKTGDAIRSYAGHTGRVGGVAWTPDGKQLVSAGNAAVLVHDAVTGAQRQRLEVGSQSTDVDLSPDGKRVLAGSFDAALRVWALDTGALLFTAPQGGRIQRARFSPDGTLIAAAVGNDVHVCAADTGATKATIKGHAATVTGLAWAPDGRLLASVSDDHTVRVWFASDAKELWRAADATDELWSVAYDPRGKYLATVGKDGTLRVYDAMQGRLAGTRLLDDKKGLFAVAWAPDGETVVTGTGSGRVSVQTMAFKSRVDAVPPIPEHPPEPRPVTPKTAEYRRAMEVLDAWHGRGENLHEAQAILEDAVKADPKNGMLLAGLAQVALKKGFRSGEDYSKESLAAADELLTRALAVSPDDAVVHLERGWLSYYEKDDVRASEEATTADRLDSTTSSQLLLGRLACRNHDYDEAEARALHEIEIAWRGRLSAGYDLLTTVYRARGDMAAAARAYERILELDPTSAWSLGNFASFLVEDRQYDRAIETAEAALKRMDYGVGHQILAHAHTEKGGDALWDTKKPELAKSEFDAALVALPSYPYAHYGLGAYFRQRALQRHDPALLARSNEEFGLAAKLGNDSWFEKARAENDKLADRVKSGR